MKRLSRNKIIWIITVGILILIGAIIWYLVENYRGKIDHVLSSKVEEFKNYDTSYTLDDAKEDGFYVEETITEGAPDKVLRFIENVWQKNDVDVSIAKKNDNVLWLSYLAYHNNVIYVLDYNTLDGTYKISEYNYLTYDYNAENGIHVRYLTNDKGLYGKDSLTNEQKKNCYYLCSYR